MNRDFETVKKDYHFHEIKNLLNTSDFLLQIGECYTKPYLRG